MGLFKLLVHKSDGTYDMTNIVEQIVWSGRKGSAYRTLQARLLDDPFRARPNIDLMEGHKCSFFVDGEECFQGMFRRSRQNQKRRNILVAQDNGYYLVKNKDTFVYSDKKASEIFTDVCDRFGIPYNANRVADTGYVIAELPKPKSTGYDVILDALSMTYDATAKRFNPTCINGKMCLLERKKTLSQWVLETGRNMIEYDRQLSTEDIQTRIKLISNEGTVLAEASVTDLESKLGVMQMVDTADDTLSKAQLSEMAQSLIGENCKPKETFNITTLGVSDVISGVCVYVIIDPLGITKSYYVDSDTHTFSGAKHTMRLTLNATGD